ncbi:MAG: NTF2 fold immunity protein, partial [Terriglobales bacterium]
MRLAIMPLSLLVAALATGHPQTQQRPSFKPKGGFVPDAETALGVAEAVLVPVYGEKEILANHPFKATLHGDMWTVEGNLDCGGPPGTTCPGGTAVVKISKTSGQILEGGSVPDAETAVRVG